MTELAAGEVSGRFGQQSRNKPNPVWVFSGNIVLNKSFFDVLTIFTNYMMDD